MQFDSGNFIVSLWEAIKSDVPEKRREDVAAQMLEVLLRYDVVEDVNDLTAASGSDDHLDSAIDILVEEGKDPEYNDFIDIEEDF